MNTADGDSIDSQFGFDRITEGSPRLGWLLNYLPLTFPDESGTERAAMDLYFLDREGNNFKATIFFNPYFYVVVDDDRRIAEVANQLQSRYNGCKVDIVEKEDLDMQNHLSGRKRKLLKLVFLNVTNLQEAKSSLLLIVNTKRRNKRDDENDGQHDRQYENLYEGKEGKDGDMIHNDPLFFISEM